MKHILFPIGLLCIMAIQCHPKADNCLRAKVIRVSCASFVVQVLNKDSIGSYGWKDIAGHGVYNNVFRVSNACTIGKWAKGEEFNFVISDSLKQEDCMTCMMFDAPPEMSHQITNVTSAPCK